jgi:propanediol dehydratase small subunit
VLVRAPDVVYVKSILEASEGLGAIFAERGGELFMAAPFERAAELEELLADLALEIGAVIDPGFGAEDAATPSVKPAFGAEDAATPSVEPESV